MKSTIFVAVALSLLASSCAVLQPGQLALKQTLGKLKETVYTEGIVFYNPFVTKVIRASAQTTNLELSISLPSKEGLSIVSQISILYKIDKAQFVNLVRNIGLNYEAIISNVFRSASADVCAQFFAKDMHSGMRADIEKAIKVKMNETFAQQGIMIDAVLMKSIQLPPDLSRSIEQKLQAEQDAMRMEFVLQQAKLEADRKLIEATGIRDAQKVIAEGLTDQVIKIRSIEAFQELARSANAKVIITDGKAPFLLGGEK